MSLFLVSGWLKKGQQICVAGLRGTRYKERWRLWKGGNRDKDLVSSVVLPSQHGG